MVSLIDIICAPTLEARQEVERQFREQQKNAPSDSEHITAFLRECTDLTGKPILKQDEHAFLSEGAIQVVKMQ